MPKPLHAACAVLLAAAMATTATMPARAGTVIDDWSRIQAPPAPTLAPVAVDPKTTALLVLDIVRQGCNAEHRPRCLDTLPAVHELLGRARAAGVMVGYSLVRKSVAADILPPVAPLGGEPVVTSGTDKFLGTDLDATLKARGIKTVIVLGVVAQGAVLMTATEAALRGYRVVVPVDGVSSDTIYAEQFTAWNLVNAPVIAGHVALTRSDMIGF
jgi:nicotinamidase-related amidase